MLSVPPGLLSYNIQDPLKVLVEELQLNLFNEPQQREDEEAVQCPAHSVDSMKTGSDDTLMLEPGPEENSITYKQLSESDGIDFELLKMLGEQDSQHDNSGKISNNE